MWQTPDFFMYFLGSIYLCGTCVNSIWFCCTRRHFNQRLRELEHWRIQKEREYQQHSNPQQTILSVPPTPMPTPILQPAQYPSFYPSPYMATAPPSYNEPSHVISGIV